MSLVRVPAIADEYVYDIFRLLFIGHTVNISAFVSFKKKTNYPMLVSVLIDLDSDLDNM